MSQLWSPGASVFAILDGARERGLCDAAIRSGLPQRCLYDGKLAPALEANGPRLIQLQPNVPFSEWLLDRGRGRSWGVFLRTRVPLDELRRHLRRFLMVLDSRGEQVYFRFYDPRVLRAYLPTCNADERRALFGPIECFFAEAASGELLRFDEKSA